MHTPHLLSPLLTHLHTRVHVRTEVSSQVDDTVCSVYRPQVRATVHSTAVALRTSLGRLAALVDAALARPGDAQPAAVAAGDRKTLELLLAKADASVAALHSLCDTH